MENSKVINSFQKYLSLWVLLCMVIGVMIGYFMPFVPKFLETMQI